MGFFGRKGLGSNSNGSEKKLGGLSWMQAIQEAKIKKARMNDLKNIYHENQNSGAHMVWQHLRDESGNKMNAASKHKPHHEHYVQRALKKAAQNENYNSREGNFMSTSSRDQVLLMYRAAQKNKTKAGQMLVGKGRKENLNYYPGMLTGSLSDRNSDAVITDFEAEDEEEHSRCTLSESSSQAYQKLRVEPLAQSSRDVSRSGHSWQPLSLTALQEYSPQITVTTKATTEQEKMWRVV
ncbi:hypothetical protein ACHWQZ_G004761 [Mnemiopsis leidyi]